MILNKHLKHKIIFILTNIILCFPNIAHPNAQIIQIHSLYQSINTLNKTIHFTGQVILKYKNIEIHADKIIITQIKNKLHLSNLQAYGNPVILYHVQQSKCITSTIQSSTISYDAISNIITFNGNVYIEQSGNSIRSDTITYSINNKKICAISNTGNLTTAIFSIKPTQTTK